MSTGLSVMDQLNSIRESIPLLWPEWILVSGIFILLLSSLIRNIKFKVLRLVTVIIYTISIFITIIQWPSSPVMILGDMMRCDDFSGWFKLLFLSGGILSCLIPFKKESAGVEYLSLMISVVLGSSLLAMTMNLIMMVLSIELISLSSYLLTGLGSDKKSAEGSLKYFIFGSVSTAIMIYGFSILYGMSGSLNIASQQFTSALLSIKSPMLLIACIMGLAGLLYKMAAPPFHLWAPDIYDSAPLPVVALFSVVPKLAGLAILIKFVQAINLFGQSGYDWQSIIAFIALIAILAGNLAALTQQNPRRMMAYSSIAQSGFLLIGVAVFNAGGIQFLLFYGSVLLIMNFLVFSTLDQFEKSGTTTVQSFSGMGIPYLVPSIGILVGLISLTGLPPTAGFSAKLFIFSLLWESYQQSGKEILLWLFLAGILNTVISLFFYLKIPYHLFMKAPHVQLKPEEIFVKRNLLTLILVILLLYLFFQPHFLMGWINRITFVL